MARVPASLATGASTAAVLFLLVGCDAAPTAPAHALRAQATENNITNPQPRPFHGATAGRLLTRGPAPAGRCPADLPLLFTYGGAGEATHLGEITVEGGDCAFTVPGHPELLRGGAGLFTFTAANGDGLTVAYVQASFTVTPGSPWTLWSAPIQLREGTGRFTGAHLLDVVWHGGINRQTGETWSVFDGAIVY